MCISLFSQLQTKSHFCYKHGSSINTILYTGHADHITCTTRLTQPMDVSPTTTHLKSNTITIFIFYIQPCYQSTLPLQSQFMKTATLLFTPTHISLAFYKQILNILWHNPPWIEQESSLHMQKVHHLWVGVRVWMSHRGISSIIPTHNLKTYLHKLHLYLISKQ